MMFGTACLLPVTLSAAPAVEPEPWLYDQIRLANQRSDLAVERDALQRLAMLPDNLSGQMRLLRFELERGKGAAELIETWCRRPDSRVCREAKAIEAQWTPAYRRALARVRLLETAGRYDEALQALTELTGGVPADTDLRQRYFELMHRIPGREDEGLRALAALARENPKDVYLQEVVTRLTRSAEIERLSDFGLENFNVKGRRGEARRALLRLLTLAPDDPRAARWRINAGEAGFWDAMERAEAAEKARDWRRAEAAYREAAGLRADNPYVWTGLSGVAEKEGRRSDALRAQQRAVSLSKGLSASEAARIRGRLQALLDEDRRAALARQYAELEKKGDTAGLLVLITKEGPNETDPWEVRRMAQTALERGRPDVARSLFEGRGSVIRTAEWAYPYALVLCSAGETQKALDVLKAVSVKTPEIAALHAELHETALWEKAEEAAEAGNWKSALSQTAHLKLTEPWRLARHAQWARQAGERQAALDDYAKLLSSPDYRFEALLGTAELLFVTDPERAKTIVRALALDEREKPGGTLGFWDIARMDAVLQQTASVDERLAWLSPLLMRLLETGDRESMLSAGRMLGMLHEDAGGRAHRREALAVYSQTLARTGLAAGTSSAEVTQALRTSDTTADDWLVVSLKGRTEDLWRAQTPVVRTGVQYLRDTGTPGLSDVTRTDVMAEAEMPLHNGRLTLRTDRVHMKSGGFGDFPSEEKAYGTARLPAKYGRRPTTSVSGTSVALKYEDDRGWVDIGTVPLGFRYDEDLVGSVGLKGETAGIGWQGSVYRRAVDASLLSWSGALDPVSGLSWGGVRRTGVELSVSKDDGGRHGFWGLASAEKLRGHNVADNTAVSLMGGWYMRLVDRPNRRIVPGMSLMYIAYDRDLSGYTLGQGGYWSPQSYVSAGVSLFAAERTADWLIQAEGSVGISRARYDDARRYPLAHLIPDGAKDKYWVDKGNTSLGIGWRLKLGVEHRINSRATAGLWADYRSSEDYSPFIGGFHLRWYLDDWAGDMPLQIQPLVPYSAW